MVRRHVKSLDEGRPLFRDHSVMFGAVKSLVVLDAVESEIGELATY
jgi:hypothetical protein